jgi:hypothetical protein
VLCNRANAATAWPLAAASAQPPTPASTTKHRTVSINCQDCNDGLLCIHLLLLSLPFLQVMHTKQLSVCYVIGQMLRQHALLLNSRAACSAMVAQVSMLCNCNEWVTPWQQYQRTALIMNTTSKGWTVTVLTTSSCRPLCSRPCRAESCQRP